jgi:hypothetical protein
MTGIKYGSQFPNRGLLDRYSITTAYSVKWLGLWLRAVGSYVAENRRSTLSKYCGTAGLRLGKEEHFSGKKRFFSGKLSSFSANHRPGPGTHQELSGQKSPVSDVLSLLSAVTRSSPESRQWFPDNCRTSPGNSSVVGQFRPEPGGHIQRTPTCPRACHRAASPLHLFRVFASRRGGHRRQRPLYKLLR